MKAAREETAQLEARFGAEAAEAAQGAKLLMQDMVATWEVERKVLMERLAAAEAVAFPRE